MKKYLIILFACISYLGYGQDVVNVGTSANAGDGDPLRTAFQKINTRFAGDMDSISDHQSRIAALEAYTLAANDTLKFTSESDPWLFYENDVNHNFTVERPQTSASYFILNNPLSATAGSVFTNGFQSFYTDGSIFPSLTSIYQIADSLSFSSSISSGLTNKLYLQPTGLYLDSDSIFFPQQSGLSRYLKVSATGSLYTDVGNTIYTAGNGMNISNDSIHLGGTLHEDTEFTGVDQNFNIFLENSLATEYTGLRVYGGANNKVVVGSGLNGFLNRAYFEASYYAAEYPMARIASTDLVTEHYIETSTDAGIILFSYGAVAANDAYFEVFTETGITLQSDSIFFTNQAGAGDLLLSLSPTGSLQTEAIEEASKILVMPLEPAWKRFFDRQNGELKAYYIDKNKEVKYMYGLGSPAQSITQIQGNTEINLRYIIRLWLAVGLLFVMNIGLFVYVIKLKR